jgi:hypothetical protein
MRFSFSLEGEIMAGKPEWLGKIEGEQSAKLIAQQQERELAASQNKILKDGMPKLWERVKSVIKDTLLAAELQGMTFAVDQFGSQGIKITFLSSSPLWQGKTMDVIFRPESQKIETFHPTGRHDQIILLFGVSNGRITLSDSAGILADDEQNDLAQVACQRLLEPVLKSYIAGAK